MCSIKTSRRSGAGITESAKLRFLETKNDEIKKGVIPILVKLGLAAENGDGGQ